ncbi:uncharacterized protein LOC126292040 isoform X2 [Schistocerca gregaria]|nr:uncharacterized protein LOC126292040 isoform X2 [Schistocerca gregaria]XP_049841794.1 uncharacterized protein LOC126292040 isoform X2 [Schistocerca gregaria]
MLWVLSQERYHHHCLPIREMAILTQCSCGCYLKTATISIAIFYLVSSRAQIATTAYNLEIHQYVGGDEVKAEETVADTKLEVITGLVCGIIHTVCSIILLVGVTQEKASKLIPWIVVETLGTAVEILLFIVVFIAASSYSFIIFLLVFAETKLEVITGLVCGIIHTVCSIIVLVGATQEKATVLLPWIVLETLGTAAAIVICVVVFMAAGSYGLLIVAMTFLLLLLNIYFLRVVYSYFRSLCERPRSAKLTDMETAGM